MKEQMWLANTTTLGIQCLTSGGMKRTSHVDTYWFSCSPVANTATLGIQGCKEYSRERNAKRDYNGRRGIELWYAIKVSILGSVKINIVGFLKTKTLSCVYS